MNTTSVVSPLASDLLLIADQHLLRRLHRVRQELRKQCREGWDVNAMLRLHAELCLLADEVQSSGNAEPIGEQLLALRTALGPAVNRSRLPDNGTTALVAALGDNLARLLPAASAPEAAQATAPKQSADASAAGLSRILVVGLDDDEVTSLLPALESHPGVEGLHVAETLAVLEER